MEKNIQEILKLLDSRVLRNEICKTLMLKSIRQRQNK